MPSVKQTMPVADGYLSRFMYNLRTFVGVERGERDIFHRATKHRTRKPTDATGGAFGNPRHTRPR